jgi:NTP pyrophosphatase (non-canonical NTP hydrolase)
MPRQLKYRIKYSTHRDALLDDYFHDFSEIWRRDFDERSVFDLWMHVIDHASRVARAIRQQQPPMVIDDIADTTAWLFSFVAQCINSKNTFDSKFKFEETPAKIIWFKYPGVCPSCLDFWMVSDIVAGLPPGAFDEINTDDERIVSRIRARASQYSAPKFCDCVSRATNFVAERHTISRFRVVFDEIRVKYAKILMEQNKAPVKIDDIQRMFGSIFSNIHSLLSLETIALHLLEEVGEATAALKDIYTFDDGREPYTERLQFQRKMRFMEEIADIFSWLFTLGLKLETTYVADARQYREVISKSSASTMIGSLSFADIIWSKYGRAPSGGNWDNLKCPGCQQAPCECRRDLKIDWRQMPTPVNDGSKPMESKRVGRDIIFVSYSHKDDQWRERLETMLKPLIRGKTISLWSDKQIRAGQLWKNEIESALSRSTIAILLVSDNFLASDFIAESELPPLLKKAEADGLRIIWIPISSCLYQTTSISEYQAACDPNMPLDAMTESVWKTTLARIARELQ